MRSVFLLAAFVVGLALHGANLIPNGDLKDPKGKMPHVQYDKSKGKHAFSGDGVLLKEVTPEGAVRLNYYQLKMTAPQAGKRYFVRVPFEVLEMGSGKVQKASFRVFFWDKDKKNVNWPGKKTALIVFSPDVAVKEPGRYDLFYSFTMPKEAEYVTFSFSFYGIKSFRAEKFFCSTEFPVDSPDGNLIINGGLETPTLASFYFRGLEKSPLRSLERSADKAKTGRWSLRSVSENPVRGTEINFNALPFTPGKKYRFSVDYFVASRDAKSRISGRVTFWNAQGKVIRHMFPEGKSAAGEWHTFAFSFFPPAGCARVTVTVWVSGKQVTYLDNFYYGIVEEKTPANRNAAVVELADTPDCTIWKEAPYLKVPPKGVPAGAKKGTAVELAAAANETEPFQLVISAKKDLPGVTLAFSPLKGAQGVIPAGAVSFRRVGFINIKNPDNPALKGLNADPLFPETVAAAGPACNLPFYVTVAVPHKTAPGIYEGKCRVLSGSRELGSFALKLRVFDFELPDSPYLRTYFYTRAFPNYNEFDKRPAAVKAENFHKLLQEHRMTGNQAMPPPAPVFEIRNGNLVVTDWSKFDENISHRSKVYGQKNFPVPYLGMKGDNGGWFMPKGKRGDHPGKSPFATGKNMFGLISPEGLKYAGQFAAAFTAHVKEKFPGLVFYSYIYDEPPAKVYADLTKLTRAIHAAAPDLKIFVPKHVTDEIGYVHTFCVPLGPGHLKPELHAAHVKKGGDIWYYNWRVRLSNHDYISNRIYAWQIYSALGNGGLLWNTVWTQKGVNPWTDLEKTHGSSCGGATIFYPPRKAEEGNIPSQRAAMIRESIDDFDYMRILEKLIDARYPGAGRARVMEILKALMPNPPFDYTNDPHLLYAVRLRLAGEIEAFKQFPATVISVPADNSKVDVAPVKFKVFAPAGTEVRIDGKAAGKTSGTGAFEVPFVLGRTGVNKVRIELASGGKARSLERTYELAADPRLKELEGLVQRAAKAKIDTKEATAFLARVKTGIPYTEKERARAAELVDKLKYAFVSGILKNARRFVNPLERFFFERARETFGWKLFERAEYYIALADEAAKFGDTGKFKVRVTPATFRGHSALKLDNGIIQATILETGGTVVSFKIDGVETLIPGTFNRVLPPEKRAAQKVSRELFTQVGGYDGFTDADGHGIWTVAFVDWNIALRELSSDRAALTFSTRIPGTAFLLKRTMSMKAGSPDLVMTYEISNLIPPELASDDPEHHQLPWRGRFMPGIGSGDLPQLNDKLVVPVKFPGDKLAESHFLASRLASYERRSIRLGKPFMGAYDTDLHKGLVIIGGPVTSHAYVWFSSKGNHLGTGKVYSLEFPRSFYGKKHNDPEPNSPLTIHPGKTLTFTLTLRGLSNVKDDADLMKQAGF